VVYLHGGGWVLGGSDTHDRLVRELANLAQVAVVFVNYTLSPEAKYPVSLEQAYAATKWVAENGQV
jgi:acetyl esterase